ncbi:MAG: DNA primase [Ignavibacteriales bacterium]|nr:DNA primase [Ignavibacteriales bacterium]
MIIPENKIEEVRSAVNIVDVISESVQLRKRGKNYVGLCPFHQEKTPSFTVSSDKQIFHCFGCHAGGNVFKFLMDLQNISFVEAVQDIAKRAGINLEFQETAPTEEQSEQEILYDINTLVARFFLNNLLQSLQGEIARNYFAERNIKLQTQRIFGLGYALPEWESIVKFVKENNIDLDKAKYLGIIEKNESGGYYDKFRGRIIFPIFSPNGRVIAFGGRVMEKSENTAKYLNSPESAIYSKRRSLYGLYHSKEEIRKLDKALLVEGYMDLISLYQGGVKNVVASSGTALTEEQVQMLSRYTKNVVVFYDADPAGIKASIRSIELLVKQDFDVKIAELPKGEDPDSFIQKFGREEFDDQIKKAQNFLEYQSAQYEKQGLFNDPTLQTKAIRDLVQSAAFVNDELKRSILLKSISRKFNLREKLLEAELEKLLKISSRRDERKTEIKTTTNDQNGSLENIPEAAVRVQAPSERELIKLLYEGDKKIVEFIFHHLAPEDFSNRSYRYLANLIFDALTNDESIAPAVLVEKIEDDRIKQFVFNLSFEKYTISKSWEDFYPGVPESQSLTRHSKDAVRSFKLFHIDLEIKQNNDKIKSAKSDEEIVQLMKANITLEQDKKLIQNDIG